MPDVRLAGLVAVVVIVSWASVAVVYRYAVARGVLDTPSARSSHAVPTPRGGGAGLLIAAILGFAIMLPARQMDWQLIFALAAIVPTAIVGWQDDHGSASVSRRVTCHLASGALILPLTWSAASPIASAVVAIGWLIAAVSAINVVNFMDGIDGLIGLQAVVFGLHVAVMDGPHSQGGVLGLALAAAAAGFLIWNWSPARIFLGDVGSGTISVVGLIAGILVWRTGAWPFFGVFLPLFPIFLDASVTIARRALRSEPLTLAHRTHLYQRLANERGWGHARVSLLYGVASILASVTVLAVARERTLIVYVLYAITTILVGAYLDWSTTRRSRAAT